MQKKEIQVLKPRMDQHYIRFNELKWFHLKKNKAERVYIESHKCLLCRIGIINGLFAEFAVVFCIIDYKCTQRRDTFNRLDRFMTKGLIPPVLIETLKCGYSLLSVSRNIVLNHSDGRTLQVQEVLENYPIFSP